MREKNEKRRRESKNIPTAKKMLLLCEGDTEEAFFRHELKGYRNIEVVNVGGGGYKRIADKLAENKDLYRIFLVVCDLDKAHKNPDEMSRLGEVIKWLQTNGGENNIFLTYENFECWVAAYIGINISDDYNKVLDNLGYKKGEAVVRFLQDHEGDTNKARELFASIDATEYFFWKEGMKWKASYNKANSGRRQSNLVYFFDYLKLLINR